MAPAVKRGLGDVVFARHLGDVKPLAPGRRCAGRCVGRHSFICYGLMNPRKSHSAGQPVTRAASIGVVGWSGPSTDPVTVDLVVETEKWSDYRFRLTFRSGELLGVEAMRQPGAVSLTAHLLQRLPLGGLERVARAWITDFMADWAEAVQSSAAPMNPNLQSWYDQFAEAGRVDREDRSERDERIAKLSKRYVETLDFPRQADLLAREFDYSRLSIPKVIAEAAAPRVPDPDHQGSARRSVDRKDLGHLERATTRSNLVGRRFP